MAPNGTVMAVSVLFHSQISVAPTGTTKTKDIAVLEVAITTGFACERIF